MAVGCNFGPLCNYGARRMRVRLARMNDNYGRSFYWCPHDMNHVGGFIWANEILHVNVVRQSEANPFGRYSTWSSVMLCAFCACNIILCFMLFLAFFIIMLNM